MRKTTKIEENVDGHRLLAMLRQTHDAVLRIRQVELRKFNLTPEQSAALVNIHALGKDATITELARRLFRKSNSITVLVMRMEKRGLLKKTRDRYKRNTVRLTLTKKGQACLKKAVTRDSFNDFVGDFPLRKRQQLWVLLEQLRNHAMGHLNMDSNAYSDFFNKL
jgi:DNA-binding MarR family transcriptional regulator